MSCEWTTIHIYDDSGYLNITHSVQDGTHKFKDLIITEETLTAEKAIELLFEIIYGSKANKLCKEYFGETYLGFVDIYDRFTLKEIVKKLTEYKQSKQIHIVSKEEYDKIASDKLDELYPK